MGRKLLLIDYENIQKFDLSRLAGDVDVLIFLGADQKTLPRMLVTAAHKLGNRVDYVTIEGNGRNALDFHIACHLGRILEKERGRECIVLSHDGGFDPLLKFLNGKGLKCRRINNLSELAAGPPSNEDANYKRVVETLNKSPKNARPRKSKTLMHHISAMFSKKLSQTEIDTIITRLKTDKLLTERDGTISY